MTNKPEYHPAWHFRFQHPDLGPCVILSRHVNRTRLMRPHEYVMARSRGRMADINVKEQEYRWHVTKQNGTLIGIIQEHNRNLVAISNFDRIRIPASKNDKNIIDLAMRVANHFANNTINIKNETPEV